MPNWLLLVMPLLAGSMLTLQAGINGLVARTLPGVLAASLVSFSVGAAALLLLAWVNRDLPTWLALREMSWWQWGGGLLGAFFIATAAFCGPRIGAVLFMALVLAGQLGMALLLDHNGWAGFRASPITVGKAAGLVLIVSGVWLIRRG
ncbi:DMT family transporter [Pseudomonas sp. PDM15]|uniref:DMT family transporter n=1 Tax=Pseudomonas sp. PDM15 TaxID=2769303 RepID=UPI0017820F53|nr:DMT family transporter [Pseudomonas sp. PDM15]MBD9424483.1 DMT family transporter [Pseudomonas sp. PDM15]